MDPMGFIALEVSVIDFSRIYILHVVFWYLYLPCLSQICVILVLDDNMSYKFQLIKGINLNDLQVDGLHNPCLTPKKYMKELCKVDPPYQLVISGVMGPL